eukprot:INCI7052.3.p1 GENE.INCI7052.3~~INCI7052.3.p1  ORF type:complete len:1482 (-),score=299.61 INCI7052.3:1843-6288(-)
MLRALLFLLLVAGVQGQAVAAAGSDDGVQPRAQLDAKGVASNKAKLQGLIDKSRAKHRDSDSDQTKRKARKEAFLKKVLGRDAQSAEREKRADLHENKALARACKQDIRKYCKDVPLGNQRVRHCMQDHKYDPGMDKECQQEVIFDQITRAASYDSVRLDLCTLTVQQLCTDIVGKTTTTTLEPSSGASSGGATADDSSAIKDALIHCLISNADSVGKVAEEAGELECEDEIFREIRDESEDIRFSPDINVACENDMARFCTDVKPGKGRMHKCLKHHLEDLTPACLGAEFAETMRESKDVRLKASIVNACKGATPRACKDIIDPADRLECLQDHLSDPTITAECRKELEDDLEIEAKSVVFHPTLQKRCGKKIIPQFCDDAETSRRDDVTGELVYGADNPTLYCLIAHVADIPDAHCRKEVQRIERLQATSIKYDLRAAKTCKLDISKFCADVPDEEGSLRACLEAHLDDLTDRCRASEFEAIKMASADASINVRLQRACKTELSAICGQDNPTDTADANRGFVCLLAELDNPDMGATCKKYVLSFEKLTRKDVNLRPLVVRTCAKDMNRLCSDAGLDVLSCLVDNVAKILNDDCKQLIDEEIELEARDINLDPHTLDACRGDLLEFCSEEMGVDGSASEANGHVQQCLRRNFDTLSPNCLKMQRRVVARESTSIRFKPTMKRACKKEIEKLCSLHPIASAEMLTCLRSRRDEADMGSHCREELVADEAAVNADVRADMIFMAHCERALRRYCPDTLNVKRMPSEQATHAIQQCLVANMDKMEQDTTGLTACSAAVELKLEGEASDIRLDPALASACKVDQQKFCSNIKPGSGRMHDCLRSNFEKLSGKCRIAEFETEVEAAGDIRQKPKIRKKCARDIPLYCNTGGNVLECLKTLALQRTSQISSECRQAVSDELKAESRNVELNRRLFHACEQSFSDTCPSIAGIVEVEAGAITDDQSEKLLECMLDNRETVTDAKCKDELVKELMRRASDSDLDPGIHRDCAADVHFYCANRAADEVHSCLRDNLASLSRQCRDREKKMEVQESADLRLKPVISSTCSAEIVKFCSTASDEESPGAVLMCLEDHNSADGFGIKCRSLIYEEQKRQAGSISLNAPIARYCAKPLQILCEGFLEQDETMALQCLIEHRDEPSVGGKCRALLVREAIGQASDINLDPAVNRACYFDQREFCSGVAAGGGRMYDCLEEHLDDLSDACREAEFSVLKLRQEDVRFNAKLATQCGAELRTFCSSEHRQFRESPAAGAAVITCLERHRSDAGFGASCSKAVGDNLKIASKDIDLRPVLMAACKSEITRLCPAKAHSNRHRGQVIQCLLDNIESISDAACQSAAFQQAEQQAKDINVAAAEMVACIQDAQKLCPEFVTKQAGTKGKEVELKRGVRKCLAQQRSSLSEACASAEFHEAKREAGDARLANSGQLAESCKDELVKLCSDIAAGSPGSLSCLVLKRICDAAMLGRAGGK